MLLIFLLISHAEGRVFCEKTKIPVEVGEWRHDLQHMDSAVVENKPVSINEGQMYVYENSFPGFTIRYINVDNLAVFSCGASATIKKGGVGSPFVLIVLHAETNQEIRSVIDIWGSKECETIQPKNPLSTKNKENLKSMRSLYLFKNVRAVSHNGYDKKNRSCKKSRTSLDVM